MRGDSILHGNIRQKKQFARNAGLMELTIMADMASAHQDKELSSVIAIELWRRYEHDNPLQKNQ